MSHLTSPDNLFERLRWDFFENQKYLRDRVPKRDLLEEEKIYIELAKTLRLRRR
jgi:hypothetical protein